MNSQRPQAGLRISDSLMLERALGILQRMATEQVGWRASLRRWYYSAEPLRNDAANLVREAKFSAELPEGCRLVGDPP